MSDNFLLASIADLQQLLKGTTSSQSLAILNNVMAETIGMSMHNAVTAQHNAQMLNSATTTSTCARILSVIGAKIPPPASPTPGGLAPAINSTSPPNPDTINQQGTHSSNTSSEVGTSSSGSSAFSPAY